MEWEGEKEVVFPHQEEAENTGQVFEPYLPGMFNIVLTSLFSSLSDVTEGCGQLPPVRKAQLSLH